MNPSQPFSTGAAPRTGFALLTYIYLQGLDILTTIAFLLSGVEEGNPIVREVMLRSPNPVMGLVAVKCLAVCLGLYCWLTDRGLLLQRVNYGYAALIAWNLLCLIFGLAGNSN